MRRRIRRSRPRPASPPDDHPPGRLSAALRPVRLRRRAAGGRGRAHRGGRALSSAAGPAGLAGAVRLGAAAGRATRRSPSSSARCRSRSPRRARPPARTCSRARSCGPRRHQGALPGRRPSDIPHYGEVTGEAVYFMTQGRKVRIPTPPPDEEPRQLGGLAQPARALDGRAGRGARAPTCCPRPTARSCWSSRAAWCGVRHRRQGPRPRGRGARRVRARRRAARARSPCWPRAPRATSRGVARRHFELRPRAPPRSGSSGSRRSGRSRSRSTRSSTRSAGRCGCSAKYREYGGSWIYPMGEDKISHRLRRAASTTPTPRLSPHDLLQQFKTHPFIRSLLEGGKRLAWGAKTIPGGGLYGAAGPPARAGRGARRRRRGLREHDRPQGRPLRDPLAGCWPPRRSTRR